MGAVDIDELRNAVFAPLQCFGDGLDLHVGCLKGVHTWSELVAATQEICGSKLKAWRALCQEKIIVSLSSFGKILRRLGASAESLPVIFENVQRFGVVTLLDWDPDMCRIFVRIKRQYAQSCVDTLAYTTSIRDVMEFQQSDNSVIPKSLFLDHLCEDLQLSEEDAEAVFNALAPSADIPLMPFNAVEWLDEWISEDLDIYANFYQPASHFQQQIKASTDHRELAQKRRSVREIGSKKDLHQRITSGDELRNILKKRFFNLIRGWRRGFRVECPRIGRHIVMNACERFGVKVNATQIWADLTTSDNLSLEQFAPQEMCDVRRFLQDFDDPVHLFAEFFSLSAGRQNWIDTLHLKRGVDKVLSDTIFEYFVLEPSAHYITSDDMQCLVRLCAPKASRAHSLLSREKMRFGTMRSTQRCDDGKMRRTVLENRKAGPQTLAEVVHDIDKRYGNVVRLIRKLFGNSSVDLTRNRFTTLLREARFTGSTTKLFFQLSRRDGSGVVPLKEWAPQVDANLTRFQEEIINRYATAEECFAFMDTDGNGSLDRKEWHAVLMNFSDVTPAMCDTLFEYISNEDTTSIALPDIQWLYKAGSLRRRPRFREYLGLAAFLNVMSRNRTKAQGWRELVDIAGRGVCHWGDFVLACKLHDSGDRKIPNLVEAWLAIMKKVRRSFLTYADVDASTAKAMLSFKEIMLHQYDSVKAAVESEFSPDQTITPKDFAAALMRLGFYGDPGLLQSWVAERHDGEITLRPWSLCVLDTWEDFFDPGAYKTRIPETPRAAVLNTHESHCLRAYILEEINSPG